MRQTGSIVAILFGLFSFLATAAHADSLSYSGKAYTLDGHFVYQSEYQVIRQEETFLQVLTKYKTKRGKVFATVETDLSQHTFIPEYALVDHRLDLEEHLEWHPKGLYCRYRHEDETRTFVIELPKDAVAISGQGLHFYIYEHLERLLTLKKPKTINFLVPRQGRFYPFRIFPPKIDQQKHEAVFKIQFDHWFIRFFTPSLSMRYDVKTRHLLEYRGPSNLLDAKGQVQMIREEFEHHQ